MEQHLRDELPILINHANSETESNFIFIIFEKATLLALGAIYNISTKLAMMASPRLQNLEYKSVMEIDFDLAWR